MHPIDSAMHGQTAATIRRDPNSSPRESYISRFLRFLGSCKEYLLLEVLNLLEPRRTSHQ